MGGLKGTGVKEYPGAFLPAPWSFCALYGYAGAAGRPGYRPARSWLAISVAFSRLVGSSGAFARQLCLP